MDIYVYKVNGIKPAECLGIIDNYKSLNFTKSFQKCGKWTLKGNYTEPIREMLEVGNLIYINPRLAGLIQSVEFSTNDKGEITYSAYGYELKNILDFRIVWNTYNHKLDADEWIRNLVIENTQGNRNLFTSIDKTKILTPKLDRQVSYKSLLEAVEEGCSATETTNECLLGFDVLCDIKNGFTFSLLEGEDKTMSSKEPYIVSRAMDNVLSLNYGETNKEAINVVKVAGEGEGADRKTAVAGYPQTTGLDRKEFFKDCRHIQSKYEDADGTTHTLTTEEYMALLQEEAENTITSKYQLSVDAESVIDSNNALDLLGAKILLTDNYFNVQVEDYVYEINWIVEQDGSLTTLTIGKGLEAKKTHILLKGQQDGTLFIL